MNPEILLQCAVDTIYPTVGCWVVSHHEVKSHSKERPERSEDMKDDLDPRFEDTCNGIPCLAKTCVTRPLQRIWQSQYQ